MEKPVETKQTILTRFLHHNMAAVGGFMGGYAILLRADFFGNAQTANLIYLVFAILGRNVTEVLIRFGAVFLYILGAMTFVFIKNKTSRSTRRIAVGIDALAIGILGLLPANVNAVLALYPIFFSMSFQWNAVTGANGYASSSIFSTNNTRQVALSLAEYLCDRNPAWLHKMFFFLGSILCFHFGVGCAYLAVRRFGIHAIFFNWIILSAAVIWLVLLERSERAEA